MMRDRIAAVARGLTGRSSPLFKDRKGITSVEFAVAAIPVLLLVLGIVMFGMNMMALGALDNATKYAGRQLQIGNMRGTTDAEVRTLVCSRLGTLLPGCTTALKIYATSGATFATLVPGTVTATALTPTTFSPGTAGSAVLLQVAYVSPYGLTLAKITGLMLTSVVVFRNEP